MSEGTSATRRRSARNYSVSVSGENKMAKLIEKTGKTRGRNPRDIKYNVLDSVPANVAEFSAVTGISEEKDFVELLYEGYNSQQYSLAADEIGEYISDSWDKDTAAQFRLAVRNMAKMTGFDIETVVAMIKPAVENAVANRKAEAEKLAKEEAEKAEAEKAQ